MKVLATFTSVFLELAAAVTSAGERPLWETVLPPTLGALVAAGVGGWWVQTLLTRSQVRREKEVREEHQRQEEAVRAEQRRHEEEWRHQQQALAVAELRNTLSLEMMEVAYSFYMPLQEMYWRLRYKQELPRTDPAANEANYRKLDGQYERFRIEARVLEAKLELNDPDSEVRWLWHGVVDTLVARYYLKAQPERRFNDLIKRHGQHKTDPEDMERIPQAIRERLPSVEQMRDESAVVKKFEELLNEALLSVRGLTAGTAILPHVDPRELSSRTSDHEAELDTI